VTLPRVRAVALLLAATLLGGCASVGTKGTAARDIDPWESWNRKVFGFNEALDKHLLVPVATGYGKVVPQPVRTGVTNFFGNVADAWSAVNNFLQGKLGNGLQDVMRVGTNTVFGFAGLLDIATEAGLHAQREDLGQTLGRWGFASGPYVVWPVLGPSSVRESFALPLDRYATASSLFSDAPTQVGMLSLELVNTRANLLGASRMLDDIALDKYSFVRGAYLQRRQSLVYDGDPPLEDYGDDDLPDYDDELDADPPAPAGAASGAQ